MRLVVLGLLAFPAIASLACGGGQTFDDGADEVRTLRPETDAGPSVPREEETPEAQNPVPVPDAAVLAQPVSDNTAAATRRSDASVDNAPNAEGMCSELDVGQGGPVISGCPCSRQPAGASSQCRIGTGKRVTQSIGPSGGTITLDGTPATLGVGVTLNIPSGALAEEVIIGLTESALAPPLEFFAASPIYYVTPGNLELSLPMQIRLPFDVPEGEIPELAVFTGTDSSCTLEAIANSSPNAGFIDASSTSLGWFASGAILDDSENDCP